jgi:hypothetical protein
MCCAENVREGRQKVSLEIVVPGRLHVDRGIGIGIGISSLRGSFQQAKKRELDPTSEIARVRLLYYVEILDSILMIFGTI